MLQGPRSRDPSCGGGVLVAVGGLEAAQKCPKVAQNSDRKPTACVFAVCLISGPALAIYLWPSLGCLLATFKQLLANFGQHFSIQIRHKSDRHTAQT